VKSQKLLLDKRGNQILLCIFSGGHALLVGVPGLAKTLLVNTLAASLRNFKNSIYS
jgi:MoxR-like ATPase